MKDFPSIPLVSSLGWSTTKPILLYSVRAGQFIFTVTTLGLLSYVINEFISEDTTNYGLAVSVMSLVYLIAIAVFTLLIPGSLIPGALLIAEFVLMTLWFCAFISLAAIWGPLFCSQAVGTIRYSIYFYSYDFRTPCSCAQAAIAMAGVCWVLFAFSCFLLLRNIVLPLSAAYSDSSIWQALIVRNFAAHRVSGLALSQNTKYANDFEAAGSGGCATPGNNNTEPSCTEKTLSEESGADPRLLITETNADDAIDIDTDPIIDLTFQDTVRPGAFNN